MGWVVFQLVKRDTVVFRGVIPLENFYVLAVRELSPVKVEETLSEEIENSIDWAFGFLQIIWVGVVF